MIRLFQIAAAVVVAYPIYNVVHSTFVTVAAAFAAIP